MRQKESYKEFLRKHPWFLSGMLVLCLTITLGIGLAPMTGCIDAPIPGTEQVDPETNEPIPGTEKTTKVLDPKYDELIMKVDTIFNRAAPPVVATTTAINPVWGGLAGLGVGLIGGLLSAYKKYRPIILEAQDNLSRMAAGSRAAAEVIETVVKPNVEAWKKAKPMLNKASTAGAIMPDEVGTVAPPLVA